MILSSAGLFQFEAVPDNQPFEQDKPSVQWKQLIINGLWFFLFSPFYLLFWSLRPKQPEELVQTFAFVSFNLIIFAVLAGCLLYFGIQIQLFFSMPIILIAQTILMAFILIKPFIKQTGLSLLMLTMPYPFLYQVTPIFPDGQIISAFGITSWWAFCAFVPFWLSYRHLILFQSMEQALTPIRKLIRLPAFFMFIWMLISSVLSITQTKNTFSETELEKLLSENKSVFVSIYESPCITCLLNQFAGQYLYPTNTLLTQDKLIFRQINQKTSLGQAFLKKYNIQSGISFYMLYGPNQKYGLRIENHYLQPEEWFDYLKLVGGLPTVKKIEITDAPLEETFVDTLKIQELILELKQKEKK